MQSPTIVPLARARQVALASLVTLLVGAAVAPLSPAVAATPSPLTDHTSFLTANSLASTFDEHAYFVLQQHTKMTRVHLTALQAAIQVPVASSIAAPPGGHTGGGSGPVNGIGYSYFCDEPVAWPSVIGQWTIPGGCYSKIYFPNPADFWHDASWGWCNSFVAALHGGNWIFSRPRHVYPVLNAAVWFPPYVQGAGGDGHWADVVAIGPNGWVLITEMNFYWRGGGWAKVDYRFIHVGDGIQFLY